MSQKSANIGTSLAAFLGITCPVCWPAAGAFLAAIGLGFLVSLKVIIPLLVIFLAITWWGMYANYAKTHHNIGPLALSIIAGVLIPVGRYAVGSLTVTYAAIAALIGAAIWNWSLIRTCSIPAHGSVGPKPAGASNKENIATLTCPECGHKQEGRIPDSTCLASYTCGGCGSSVGPKQGDCCVFCSYSDKKCPVSGKRTD